MRIEQTIEAHLNKVKEFKNKKDAIFYDTISLTASGLRVGERTREVLCPSCQGGHSKEKSFSIFKEAVNKIKYRCWRASCGIRGIVNSNGNFLGDPIKEDMEKSGIAKKITFARRLYQGKTCPITKDGLDFFHDRYGLDEEDLRQGDVTYSPDDNRFVFPVYSPLFALRGVTLRTFEEGSKFPKWDHYPHLDDATWMGWQIRPDQTQYVEEGPVVIVEDPISALKASRYFIAGYLNGTEISLDKLTEILRIGRRHGVIIALDPDATAKGIEILRKWIFYFGTSCRAVPLERDLKYATDKEIRDILAK